MHKITIFFGSIITILFLTIAQKGHSGFLTLSQLLFFLFLYFVCRPGQRVDGRDAVREHVRVGESGRVHLRRGPGGAQAAGGGAAARDPEPQVSGR